MWFADRLSTLAWIFSRRWRRWRREECSRLHYHAEKDRLGWWWGLCGFGGLGVCLRKSAKSAGDIGVSFVRIDWVLLCEYSPADSADHAERNAAGCIITQRKTGWVGGEVYVVLGVWGFVCVNLRNQRETLGFRLSNIDWVLLREYSPADYADHAEECSKLHHIAEKDRLVGRWGLCGFGVLWFVCVICGRIGR